MKNIEENNLMIAEFVKWKELPESLWHIYDVRSYDEIKNDNIDDCCFHQIDKKFAFHSNWSQLMIAVEKIKRVKSFPIDVVARINEGLLNTDREKVYLSCVEGIKWYNENK